MNLCLSPLCRLYEVDIRGIFRSETLDPGEFVLLDSPTPGENSQIFSNHFTISLVGPLSYPRGKPMTCALDDVSTNNISVDCRGAQNTHDPLLLWFGYWLMISWLFRSFISRYRSLTGSRSYTEDQLRLVWIKHNVLYFTFS